MTMLTIFKLRGVGSIPFPTEIAKLALERMRNGSKDGSAQTQKPELPVSDKEVAAVGSKQRENQGNPCETVRAKTEALRTLMDQLSLSREGNPARAMEGIHSRNRRRLAITCWNCGEEGHRRSVCRQRGRQAPQSSSGNENGLTPRPSISHRTCGRFFYLTGPCSTRIAAIWLQSPCP